MPPILQLLFALLAHLCHPTSHATITILDPGHAKSYKQQQKEKKMSEDLLFKDQINNAKKVGNQAKETVQQTYTYRGLKKVISNKDKAALALDAGVATIVTALII